MLWIADVWDHFLIPLTLTAREGVLLGGPWHTAGDTGWSVDVLKAMDPSFQAGVDSHPHSSDKSAAGPGNTL